MILKNVDFNCTDCGSKQPCSIYNFGIPCEGEKMFINKNMEEIVKGYHRSNRAWYAKACKYELPNVTIGNYSNIGGTTGEFTISWVDLGDSTAQIRIFEDAITLIKEYSELFDRLSEFQNKHFNDDQLCSILDELGFKDLTDYERKEED